MPDGLKFSAEDIDRFIKFIEEFEPKALQKAFHQSAGKSMTIVKRKMVSNIKALKSIKDSDARKEYAKSIIKKSKFYRSSGTSYVSVGVERKKWPSGRNWGNLSSIFEFGKDTAYIIEPEKASVLKFKGIGGMEVFTPFAVHPGHPFEPHIRPAFKDTHRKVLAQYNQNVGIKLDKLAREVAAKHFLKKAR
jgi:hypothetical protein